MPTDKQKYDIFICGGALHYQCLRKLLPSVARFGNVHLASISLNKDELAHLSIYCDSIHHPRHDPDGYRNFNLFCTRDINRLARAPYFIKLDADVLLSEDWIDYVDGTIDREPDAVLFGPTPGRSPIDVRLEGPLVKGLLGRDIVVSRRVKIYGHFYVGKTSFFRNHDRAMQTIHELLYCFRNGCRIRPRWHEQDAEAWELLEPLGFSASGGVHGLQRVAYEDILRSLIACEYGGNDAVRVIPAGHQIRSSSQLEWLQR